MLLASFKLTQAAFQRGRAMRHTSMIHFLIRSCLCGAMVSSPSLLAHSGNAPTASKAMTVRETTHADGILELDEGWFWDGETLDGNVPDASLCDAMAPCPAYSLAVPPGGKRLRVGIGTAERTDTFVVEVIDPHGHSAGSADNSNQFNSEVWVLNPEAGPWTLRVRPNGVSRASYRLRAKVESQLPEEMIVQGPRQALLPNLRTVPPYELGFVAPANPLNGVYPPDSVNPPLAVGGVAPLSCTADEMAPVELGGGAAVRCLRFTSGPINLGPGPYDMRFSLLEDAIAGNAFLNPEEAMSRIVVGPKQQAIHYNDGSIEFLPAGTYSFHPVHTHFHDDYVLRFELYAVTDPARGSLQQVGKGTKSGFCPADQLFGNFYEFNQAPEKPGGDTVQGCASASAGVLALSIGWGDVYRWQRPGMYVEFGGQANGLYLIRSIIDGDGNVLETNDSDNVSYAYIEVQGDDIRILERGWGTDPWTADKVVFTGPGPVYFEPAKTNSTPPTAQTGASTAQADDGGGGPMTPALILPLLCAGLARRWGAGLQAKVGDARSPV